MSISEDRWTCPQCNWTTVISRRVNAWESLRAAQDRHALKHGHVPAPVAAHPMADQPIESAQAG